MLNFFLLVATVFERTDLLEFQYQVDKNGNKMKCSRRSDETKTENALTENSFHHSVLLRQRF